jgi:hypothetical protein
VGCGHSRDARRRPADTRAPLRDSRFGGQATRWTLSLIPTDPALLKVISRITIDGTEAQIARIEVDERMGDSTVLVVQTGTRAK